jgi:type II secretory pathway pseudopilin PulG
VIPRRSYLLLEVVVGLALLATVAGGLLVLETSAVRQYRRAQEQQRIAGQVEQLLWSWRLTQTAVTLPATGRLDERYRWRREVRPVHVASRVTADRVSVIVTVDDGSSGPRDVYRVDWLVAPAGRKGTDHVR